MPVNTNNGSPVVLIINFHSTRNAGDLALLLSNRQLLQEAFGSPRIIVSANWPDEEAYAEYGFEVVPSISTLCGVGSDQSPIIQILKLFRYFLRIINTKKSSRIIVKEPKAPWQKVLNAYLEADLVVGVSGNQFHSSGKYGWPFPATIASVSLANKFKKPLYIMPQSIGPFNRRWEGKLLKHEYNKGRKIYIRDSESKVVAKEIGLKDSLIEYSPDPAFDLPSCSKEEAIELLRMHGVSMEKPKLGVTIISPMGRSLDKSNMNNYYNVLNNVFGQFLYTFDSQIVFFNQVTGPIHNENDSIETAKLYQQLKSEGFNVIHINQELQPSKLKACYGQMRIFLASRLHSGIFSMGMYVPTIFIGYLSKTRGVLYSIGLNQNVIDITELNEDNLMEKLGQTWRDADEERKVLIQKIPPIQAASHAPAKYIKEDFFQYHG